MLSGRLYRCDYLGVLQRLSHRLALKQVIRGVLLKTGLLLVMPTQPILAEVVAGDAHHGVNVTQP